MKEQKIAQSIKNYTQDKALMQKTHDAASSRAQRRDHETREKTAKQKRMKSIISITFYSTLLVIIISLIALFTFHYL